jgi:DNA repair protein RadC
MKAITSKTSQQHKDEVNESQVLEQAAEILSKRTFGGQPFCNVDDTKMFLELKLGDSEREVFAVMLLNSQHQLLDYKEIFFGTINAASVYPREIVKAVLKANAAAVILAHNHPSGVAEPSQADKAITTRIKDALALIDVPVLDHIVVAQESVSFAQRGLL